MRKYDKNQLNTFIDKWTSQFTHYSLSFEDFTMLRDECFALGFDTDLFFWVLSNHEVHTFNHDSMFFILEEIKDIEVLGSLVLFASMSKLTWELEGGHYDLYFSNFWFVLVLNRIKRLINDEIEQTIINRLILNLEHESCIIDRESGFIEYRVTHQNEQAISRYENKDFINEVMLDLSENYFFKTKTFDTEKTHVRPNGTSEYKFEVVYENHQSLKLTGYFDYYGLPLDYRLFVSRLDQIYNVRPYFKLFDSRYFYRLRKREDEFMFCEVVFDAGYKEYTYLSDDLSINVGDYVLVPAGKENDFKEVEVVNIYYQKEDHLNFPFETLKKIVKKV